MLDHIGWGEIFFIAVFALIIIGPERLPGLLKDLRAALYAARKAINNAKAELDGEFGEEFEEFKKPIAEVAKWQRMGPRRALTTALLDGDEHFMDDFDPKKVMSQGTAGQAARAQKNRESSRRPEASQQPAPQPTQPTQPTPPAPPAPQAPPVSQRPRPANPGSGLGGGFNWNDIM